jgi:hypothetical protein
MHICDAGTGRKNFHEQYCMKNTYRVHRCQAIGRRQIGEKVAQKEQPPTNQAQSFDDGVAVLVLAGEGKRRINHVAKVRLEANVEKAGQGQNLGKRKKRAKATRI